MSVLIASPTARRKEEAIREEARKAAFDLAIAKLGGMEVGASPSSPPAFTDADVEEVGRLLVEGRLRLPSHARITVTTEIEEVRSKVFGTSTVFTHTADQLCCHQLRPMSIQAALEAGLLAKGTQSQKLGGHWIWRADVYRKLVPPDPRLRPLT
jgi:hypothetical protein